MVGRGGREAGSCGDFDFAQTEKRSGGKRGENEKMPKMTVGLGHKKDVWSVERRRRSLLLPFLRACDDGAAEGGEGNGSTFTRSRERDKILSFSFGSLGFFAPFAAAFFLPFRYISNKIFREPPNLAH